MLKRIILASVLLLGTVNIALASDDRYFPSYDDHRYKFGTFWGSVAFGGYIPIGTQSDTFDVASNAGVGVTILDIFGLEARGGLLMYDKTSKILGFSGLVPNDTPGNEKINKIDATLYALIQPSFRLSRGLLIAPYAGIGGSFSYITYSYNRDIPKYSYETTSMVFGFATKAGVRFRFSNMLIGAGIEYIYSVPSNFYNINFSTLTYSIELGFII